MNVLKKLKEKKREKGIDAIAEKGNDLFNMEKFEQAVEVWKQGLKLLPEPLNLQPEAVWFQTSIADAYFMLEKYEEAYNCIFEAKSNYVGRRK